MILQTLSFFVYVAEFCFVTSNKKSIAVQREMWNSGISNWGAGSTEGNSLGMGKKRSYNDTGFSSDNNGSGFGPPPNSYMKTEFGFVFHYFARKLTTKTQKIQKQITLDKLFKSNVEFPFLS